MQIGLQVLQELAGSAETVVVPGVDLVQLAAINGSRREGYQRAINSIRKLGTEKKDQESLADKLSDAEWGGWGNVSLTEKKPDDAPAAATKTPDPTQDT